MTEDLRGTTDLGFVRLSSAEPLDGYYYDPEFDTYLEGDALFRERIKTLLQPPQE